MDDRERSLVKAMIPKNLLEDNAPCSPGEKRWISRLAPPACAAAPGPGSGALPLGQDDRLGPDRAKGTELRASKGGLFASLFTSGISLPHLEMLLPNQYVLLRNEDAAVVG